MANKEQEVGRGDTEKSLIDSWTLLLFDGKLFGHFSHLSIYRFSLTEKVSFISFDFAGHQDNLTSVRRKKYGPKIRSHIWCSFKEGNNREEDWFFFWSKVTQKSENVKQT